MPPVDGPPDEPPDEPPEVPLADPLDDDPVDEELPEEEPLDEEPPAEEPAPPLELLELAPDPASPPLPEDSPDEPSRRGAAPGGHRLDPGSAARSSRTPSRSDARDAGGASAPADG